VSRTDPNDLDAALRETVGILEATIRAHPDQWFQFVPFWPEDRVPTIAGSQAGVAGGLADSTS
jgi:predicted LPLAT superfamily acyltransferase